MSSIIKVTNGKGTHYKAIYDLPPFLDGTRRRTSKTFPVGTNLSVVKQFVAERELEYARGSNLSTDYNLTFTQFADMLLCLLNKEKILKPYSIISDMLM